MKFFLDLFESSKLDIHNNQLMKRTFQLNSKIRIVVITNYKFHQVVNEFQVAVAVVVVLMTYGHLKDDLAQDILLENI